MRLILFVAVLVMGASAYAGPPFVTDDPEPVDYQHWEFYVASMHSKFDGDWSGTAPHFELNYGVIPNVQLHTIIPLAYDVPPQGAAHYGLGDVEVGSKIRFLQDTNWVPETAIFPLLELPAGGASDALGNGHLQAFLPLWLQKTWGTWTVYGGGGYGINSFSGSGNWWFYGVVLQKQVLPNLAIGAEIYHQTDYETDFPNLGTAFNIGTTYDLTDHYHLLFSAGSTIHGHIDFQCYAAFQFTFDNSIFHFWDHPRNNIN